MRFEEDEKVIQVLIAMCAFKRKKFDKLRAAEWLQKSKKRKARIHKKCESW